MVNGVRMSRWTIGIAVGALAATLVVTSDATAKEPNGAPERSEITLGLPVPATTFLPIYIAAEKSWAPEGLHVNVVTFRGDSGAAQALAGGSVDISCQSLDGLLSLLESKQKVIGFWAGFDQADFAWFARPNIKNWSQLKGKTIGVSSYGSLTDQLTRAALREHGLDPNTDVRIIQSGPSMAAYQAVKAGRLDAAILSVPSKLMAKAEGLTLLATEAQEISPTWPKHICIADKSFIQKYPGTIEAFIRGLVKAEELAKSDPDYAIKTLEKQLKYEPKYAKEAYQEAINGFDESGKLPSSATMKKFWEITIAGGEVKKPIPDDELLDPRFVDSFKLAAPSK